MLQVEQDVLLLDRNQFLMFFIEKDNAFELERHLSPPIEDCVSRELGYTRGISTGHECWNVPARSAYY